MTARRTGPPGLAGLALAVGLTACSGQPGLQMTPLDPPRPTQDFVLTDQFGEEVRLSDFRGRVVVLTFLYTGCPDVCPLVAERLRDAGRLLGERASAAAFLVVTVDPERDTVEQLYAYSQARGMLTAWRFLTGARADLEPVWAYYWVGTVSKDTDGRVAHQAPVHLIDRQGRIRAVSGQSLRPAELAHDVEALLAEVARVVGGPPR
jgi:protein SCO1/2